METSLEFRFVSFLPGKIGEQITGLFYRSIPRTIKNSQDMLEFTRTNIGHGMKATDQIILECLIECDPETVLADVATSGLGFGPLVWQ